MGGGKFRILLVRHGQSALNVDNSLTQTQADHTIPLTRTGMAQASAAGVFVHDFLKDAIARDGADANHHVRLWQSPYKRARQTADLIMREACDLVTDRREDINLTEQQFGLFDGIPDDELPKRFPDEWAHYKKCEKHAGRFWARMPLGESRFDVAVRVRQFFPTLHQDRTDHGITNLVIVSHGVTLRAFLMQWLHLSPEWFEAEPNPGNCNIRLIEGSEDMGYVYQGPEDLPADARRAVPAQSARAGAIPLVPPLGPVGVFLGKRA